MRGCENNCKTHIYRMSSRRSRLNFTVYWFSGGIFAGQTGRAGLPVNRQRNI
ncbi:hypothetical protein BN8_03768 [Fibrisoma limi BUZ 3]|uniref:Uncharacterized protein n=1 Tax=Fibrisoma limi BUZ 3 TaxID=1185876 RepID=I2GL08_9BACT|nr:hypothetical protein BN8_03768 [Fibrisoma limi BUZ 3]